MEQRWIGVEEKTQILVDALPYIRDFHNKIFVIEYGDDSIYGTEEERLIMQDVALLKCIGIQPIVVHGTKEGEDVFRANKKIAKMIELYGVKAVGICGADPHTLHMLLAYDYIPVITPKDVDTESWDIDPMQTAREVAVSMQAEKLIYMSAGEGIYMDLNRRKVLLPLLTLNQVNMMKKRGALDPKLDQVLKITEDALKCGTRRVHLIDGKVPHSLLLEFFTPDGVGSAILKGEEDLYDHEIGK